MLPAHRGPSFQGREALRIGLLTYGLDRPLSGVTRVTLEIGRELRRLGADVTFLTPYRQGPFVGEPGTKRVYVPAGRLLPMMMTVGGALATLIAERLRMDVVHDPAGVGPYVLGRRIGRFKRVVTIHDAIAFEYPEGYPWLNNFLHRRYHPFILRNTDVIATDSEYARRTLVRFLRLGSDSVRVIPLGVRRDMHPVNPERARATVTALGIEPPYVLYVGAFQARKNLPALVDAFARARTRLPDHRLVLAGPSQWRYPELHHRISEAGLGSAVQVAGYVPEHVLPALYSAASVFVLPSLYEGFGIPVLEALACGTPVVCSSASSLPEVAGDAALLVDPRDPDAMADAIVLAALDGALRARLRVRGLERASMFTWEQTARRYLELYACT